MFLGRRRTLVWRYCALGSILIYLLSFGAFLGFVTSPTTWIDTDITSGLGHLENSTNARFYLLRMMNWKATAVARPNDTQLENLHRNMTLLKANMSGVHDIVNQIRNGNDAKALEKPVNPHDFEYIINCPHLCDRVTGDVFFIAYVHTAVDHYKRRMIIRQTWGNSEHYDVNVRLVFVMGTKPSPGGESGGANSELQEALFFEAEQYGDIVQESFIDSYRNLTHKAIGALKWISNNCARAKYVVKTDDDIFVNSFSLIARLKGLLRKGRTTGVLMGLVWSAMIVMREGKWKVEESEWKDATYPTYCSGSAFIMSTDVAVSLHAMSARVPFFWVDDFYVTGLLPLKLGNITHTQIASSYVLNGKTLEEKFTGPQWYQYLFSHVHDLNAIQAVWRKVVGLSRGEISPTIQFALPGKLPQVPHRVDP